MHSLHNIKMKMFVLPALVSRPTSALASKSVYVLFFKIFLFQIRIISFHRLHFHSINYLLFALSILVPKFFLVTDSVMPKN
jgi:hypothetical protein